LGDVLVARGVLRFLRISFPQSAITLLAPGERGSLFKQAGWVDRLFDWDRAEYAGLFAEDGAFSDKRLRDVFSGCGLLIAFVDEATCSDPVFQRNIDGLTPGAVRFCMPSRPRPEDAVRIPVGEWLLEGVRSFCLANTCVSSTRLPLPAECLDARLSVPASDSASDHAPDGKALVMHPGSGSALKNWPVENYAALARMLLASRDPGGGRLFSGLTITAGEADGALGERLCRLVPDARLHPLGGLAELAEVIAGARLYVGNDSGVSHLASLVRLAEGNGSGRAPLAAVIFGPSDPCLWSPPGALVLEAGKGMDGLPPEKAFSRIMGLFP
jgi:hypothetical protein